MHASYRPLMKFCAVSAIVLLVIGLLMIVFLPRSPGPVKTSLQVTMAGMPVPGARVKVVDRQSLIGALALIPFRANLSDRVPESLYAEFVGMLVVGGGPGRMATDSQGKISVRGRLDRRDFVVASGKSPSSDAPGQCLWVVSAAEVQDDKLFLDEHNMGGRRVFKLLAASPGLMEALVTRLRDEAKGILARQQFDTARRYVRNAAALLGNEGAAELLTEINAAEAAHFRRLAKKAVQRTDYDAARQLMRRADSIQPNPKLTEPLLEEILESEGGLVRLIEGHQDGVCCVAFSPDGSRAVSAGRDRSVRLWNTSDWSQIHRLVGHAGEVAVAIFSPDGRSVLSGGADGTILLWDAESGRKIRSLTGHTEPVTALAFSPDGKQALSAGTDGTVRLWKLDTPREVHRFEGHQKPVVAVAFSPDARCAYSASDDGTVRVWNVETGKQLRRIQTTDMPAIASMALSPDGKTMLTGGKDMRVRWCEVEMGKELRRFIGRPALPRAVGFSTDGRLAVTGHDDCSVRLWELDSGRELHDFQGHTGGVSCAAFSPNCRRVLSCSEKDKAIRLWAVPKNVLRE